MSSESEPDQDQSQPGDPFYMYKPSLVGAPCQFALRPDALQWQIGRRNGSIPYNRVRRMRISFRPATMQSHRFITEIWPASGPKIQIASTSWRTMLEQQRQDPQYAEFITELHRRLAAAGSTAELWSGTPPVLYWLGVLVFTGVTVTVVVLAARAMLHGDWAGVGILAAILAVFVYQLGTFFRRNRPRRYRADDVPAETLPTVRS
jgi:hypothetical protein